MRYEEFLSQKVAPPKRDGIEGALLNQHLFDWQKVCVRRALKAGRFALFEDCGLGKTIQQGAWADTVAAATNGRVLIVAPLCVSEQTIGELARFGIDVSRSDDARIQITNYEQLHKIEPGMFSGVVLDESSILKSIDGKTKSRILKMFRDTPFKLACTATPAPNDVTELGNHAEFLGVMTNAEMMASFFFNKGEREQKWSMKGHAVEAFYRWLSTWSVYVGAPSDLGYPDNGFILPKIEIESAIVRAEIQSDGCLFFMGLGGIRERGQVRRQTIDERVDMARRVIQSTDEQVIAWCGLNDEQSKLAAAINGESVSVSGSDSMESKQEKIVAFLAGDARVLVTKPKIVGFGMNFQCASRQVFVGLGDSYEQYYQAIRRSWRFGQTKPVTVTIVLSDTESEILENVKRKERIALKTQRAMAGRMAAYQKGDIEVKDDDSIETTTGDGWTLHHGDCVEVMDRMEPESVDLSVFSPPFSSLYTYSASHRDMGNCRGKDEFFEHFAFVIEGLMRVTKPGRLVACHCQQIPTMKAKDGVIGLTDFRGDLIRAFMEKDFIYHGEVAIDKCPQAQAIRTKAKSLLFVQLEKDSSWMRMALADYILVFRKPGENPTPIKNDLTREEWIEWARPIWYGISESNTLSKAEAREEKDEKHICPLQLGTIQRCVRLWSSKGDLVFSPFAGIGSEGYQSLLEGRRFEGAELKPSYARAAVKNLKAAVKVASTPLLFDHLEEK